VESFKTKNTIVPKISMADETKNDPVEIQIINSKDESEPFACNLCEISFKMEDDAKRHFKMHEDDSYACYLCQIPFDNFDSLRIHINFKECA
jgi:uncharacterized Zn-finger protein